MISDVSLPVNGERTRTGRIRFLFLLQQTTEADHMSFGTMILPQLVRICKRVSFLNSPDIPRFQMPGSA